MSIVENIKDAADLAKKIGDIELYRKIVHLEGEVMDLTREKRQAEQKIEELEEKLALNSKMNFKQPFYFQEGDDVPFCPRCFEKDKAAVHLFLEINREDLKRWDCHECESQYRIEGPNYHRRQYIQSSSDGGPWG
ncbi:MAG TPA: hypothetical protein VNX87_28530 [Candidatus Sulfotelmatobacter sp.]|jgi:hypothetical protein|nr:hypothetical protein [Candidatus Sulfotelmatobacter sp.]